MPTFSYKGYDFDVAHQPSAEEFTQMSSYVDTLPPKEEKKKKELGFWDTAKKTSLDAVNMADMALNMPLAAGVSAFSQKYGDKMFGAMDARIAQNERAGNPENLEVNPYTQVATTPVTFVPQVLGMFGAPAAKGRDLLKRGEPLSTAIPATLIEAGINAGGVGPMKAASTFAGRAAIGAGANVAIGAGSDAYTQLLATKQSTKDAYDPYNLERRLQEGVVGGVLQGAMGERPRAKAKPERTILNAIDDAAKAKKAPVKAVDPKAPLPDVMQVDSQGNVGTPDLGTKLAMERQAEVARQHKVDVAQNQVGANAFDEIVNQSRTGESSPVSFPKEGDPGAWMANQLEQRGATERAGQVQDGLDARQAAMEQQVKQQTTLEMAAADRARQNQASPTTPDMAAHVAAQENARLAQQSAEMQRMQQTVREQATQQATQQATTAAAARTEAASRAQASLDARLAAMELEVKQKTSLEMQAADRARQGNAPTTTNKMAQHFSKKKQVAVETARLEEAQRIAKQTQDLQDRYQMEIDDTQHVLPDTDQVIAPQYGAMDGVGRMDENGMPIKADLSMEAQNLENPLQRNLWGDELGASQGQKRSLTGAIDAMPEGVRNREGGKFAPGTTRQSALNLLRHETPASPELQAAKMKADIAAASGDNLNGFNAKMRNQGGGLLIGNKKVTVEATDFGFIAKMGDRIVGHLDSNITPEQRAQLGETANVDMVKVADDLQGKGVGKALYDAWTKANDGKVAPSGKTSPAAWKVWKRDNPAAVEAFVKQEAARIEDGSPAGQVLGNITDPEVRSRVASFNGRTRGQGGAINPDVFLKDFPEFVGSKMKDAAGQLKKFYHGTSKDVPFSEVKATARGGWFSDNPADASSYAKENDSMATKYNPDTRTYEDKNSNPHVHEVYLNIQKPYTMDAADMQAYRRTENYAKFQKELTAKAKAEGHDGIDWGGGVFTTFDTAQSKSTLSPAFVKAKGKQKGVVLFDWKKGPKVDQIEKIGAIKSKLGAFIPSTMTPAEVNAYAATVPDVKQNVLQKTANLFTKGGLYQAEKTGHPYIKYAVDKVLNADRLTRADTAQYIHDGLAPAMRALSNKEFVEVAQAMNYADLMEVDLTPAMLQEHGFNAKQVDLVNIHRTTMNKAIDGINRAREVAGKAPIDKRVAYASMSATGDFQKLVYQTNEKGEKSVIGVIGAKTRMGLEALQKRLGEKGYDTDAFGEERYKGSGRERTGSGTTAMMQALEHLAENDPNSAAFLDVLADLKQQEAYDFLNVKRHAKGKKGIFGMEGRKSWESNYTNAKDFMDAQLQYAESAMKWGHISEASTGIKEILSSDTKAPNAKKWVEGYFQNSLGMNPTKIGRHFEQFMGAIYQETGVGSTIPRNTVAYSRKAINTLLLGLNPGFIAANIVQPILSLPAMTQFLAGRGVEGTAMMGYDNFAKAGITSLKEKFGGMNAFEKEAFAYAKKNHVYGSDLVDNSTLSRKGGEYYVDKAGNFLAAGVESGTRKMMFYTFAHILNENGIKDFGLAHNLTDVAMNNYSPVERPQIFNTLGPIGDMAANLSSFKHNELSRTAMFAREVGKNGNAKPFLIQLAATVAAAGLQGIIAYEEADWLYRQVSSAMGKPDSLSRVTLEFSEKMGKYTADNKYALSHGLFSFLGLDMSKRLSSSNVIPDSWNEALFPGASKLGEIAKAGWNAVTSPSEMNAKRFARELAPGFAHGVMDRKWFSEQTPDGEMGLSRKDLDPQVIRNDADKRWKDWGLTGVNESVGKQKGFDRSQRNLAYSDKRASVLNKMRDSLKSDGKVSPSQIEDYIRFEGDPNTLATDLKTMVENRSIDMVTAVRMSALLAKTPSQMGNANRAMQVFKDY